MADNKKNHPDQNTDPKHATRLPAEGSDEKSREHYEDDKNLTDAQRTEKREKFEREQEQLRKQGDNSKVVGAPLKNAMHTPSAPAHEEPPLEPGTVAPLADPDNTAKPPTHPYSGTDHRPAENKPSPIPGEDPYLDKVKDGRTNR